MDTDTEPVGGPAVAAGGGTAGPSPARRGVLDMLPLVAAYLPFGLVIGSVAADRGTPWAGWAGSWLIYGGSAHLAAMRTLDDAGALVAIVTGLLINARLLVYGASLARRWTDQPRWFRLAAAGLVIDATWVAAERHADDDPDPDRRRRYFLAAGLTLGTGWSLAIATGALLGARLDGVDLEIVVPVCLLGLVGTGLRAAGSRAVIVAAAAVAVLTAHWPAGTGLLAAIGAGCAAGLATDRRTAAAGGAP